MRGRRLKFLVPFAVVGLVLAWAYWNRPSRTDLAVFAPADCLAFLEANEPARLFAAMEESFAWRTLAGPVDAGSNLVINRWWFGLARWFGIGTPDALLLARSQAGIVFTGAGVDEKGASLTIRPLATLVIETHSSQRRMRPVLESYLEKFARRIYENPQFSRKQIDGEEIDGWYSADGSRHIIFAFVGSAAIIGNDERSVTNCLEAKRGGRPSLVSDKIFADNRTRFRASDVSLFGFVSKAGVRAILQAYILYKSGSSDAASASRLLSDTAGNLVDGLACNSQFIDGMAEDRCFLTLAPGLGDKLRSTMVAERPVQLDPLPFVPPNANSVSIYNLRDVEGFWNDLNAIVSSHADVLGALAARPLLRLLLKPYGIDDADRFMQAIGPRMTTIRLDENGPSVLVTEPLDRDSLRKLTDQRLGSKPRTETIGAFEMSLSTSDDWGVAFADDSFLMGPAESLRLCLQAKAQSQSITSNENFRRSEHLLDVSLPVIAATFTSNRQQAISFVELFSQHERPTFSNNAEGVEQALRSLPYAISVTMLKNDGFEWTSRSAFGLPGSLTNIMAPE
jgi:hypothetical protein